MSISAMRALKLNIKALLHAQHRKQKDLTDYLGVTEGWLSNILTKDSRNMQLQYIDRMADFFRVEPYQLFQPGIVPDTNRRSGKDRRSGRDRRVSRAEDVLRPVPSMSSLEERLAQIRQMDPRSYQDFARRVEAALTLAGPLVAPEALADRPAPSAQPSTRSDRTRGARKRSRA